MIKEAHRLGKIVAVLQEAESNFKALYYEIRQNLKKALWYMRTLKIH